MAGECPGRRSPSAGARPVVGKLSLLVGLAEPFSSSASALTPSRSPTPRSPRNFDYDGGAVGLGIVAALNDGGHDAQPRGVAAVTRTPRPAAAAASRSEPIPIVSAAAVAAGVRGKKDVEEDMELSESYTCVISHVGGGSLRKKVYFDDGAGCPAALFEMPLPPPPAWAVLLPPAEDFLSRCFWCSKKLHGLDIFMYRGDRAFCSAECRCQQMISDERRETRASDAVKPFDCCSVSPCSTSTPLFFAAGVAAA